MHSLLGRPHLSPSAAPDTVDELAGRMAACRLCVEKPRGPPLPHAPRPIFVVSSRARLVIASQAPGARAHASGVPFQDASGTRLRDWLGLNETVFYDANRVMIVPMGFCFPGYDAQGGDRPPRPECRAAWHDAVFAALPGVELVVAIGLFAVRYHLARLGRPDRRGLTELVADWRALGDPTGTGRPRLMVLPHPSWRNTAWLRRHPFFEADVLPVLRAEVARLTGGSAV